MERGGVRAGRYLSLGEALPVSPLLFLGTRITNVVFVSNYIRNLHQKDVVLRSLAQRRSCV